MNSQTHLAYYPLVALGHFPKDWPYCKSSDLVVPADLVAVVNHPMDSLVVPKPGSACLAETNLVEQVLFDSGFPNHYLAELALVAELAVAKLHPILYQQSYSFRKMLANNFFFQLEMGSNSQNIF